MAAHRGVCIGLGLHLGFGDVPDGRAHTGGELSDECRLRAATVSVDGDADDHGADTRDAGGAWIYADSRVSMTTPEVMAAKPIEHQKAARGINMSNAVVKSLEMTRKAVFAALGAS